MKDDLTRALASFGNNLSYDNRLFVTLLLTGFHALLRLGELVWPDNSALRTYRKLTVRATVKVNAASFEYLLPAHKADPFFKGNHILIQRTACAPDPHSSFISYLAARDAQFPLRAELWLRANGAVPTHAWFIRKLRAIFLRDIAGHSMRTGGATSLATAGVPPGTIQALGRWSSDAWLVYIRKHPALLSAMICDGRSLHDSPLARAS